VLPEDLLGLGLLAGQPVPEAQGELRLVPLVLPGEGFVPLHTPCARWASTSCEVKTTEISQMADLKRWAYHFMLVCSS
jgi:hypothetical protein